MYMYITGWPLDWAQRRRAGSPININMYTSNININTYMSDINIKMYMSSINVNTAHSLRANVSEAAPSSANLR